MAEELEILYMDEHLVAINKPSGLLVHRSWIDRHATEFAMQKVRNQIGQHVYPVHRLDRPTSGVLVMALSSESARVLSRSFEERATAKTYLAVVRGHTPDFGQIDYPLMEEDKSPDPEDPDSQVAQPATTDYSTMKTSEISVEISRYPTSRFSLVQLSPKEGRRNQLRRHMAHIRHPIIGDTQHGDNKYNRYFRQVLKDYRLALHAWKLTLPHPATSEVLSLEATPEPSFQAIQSHVGC